MALRLRASYKPLGSPRFSHLFCSSSNGGENDRSPPPSYSSYFSDVKASLRQTPPPPPPRKLSSASSRSPIQTSVLSPKPSKLASFDEIRKNLSEFRRRSAAPQPNSQDASSSPPSPPSISFQELYKSNVIAKTTGDAIDSKSAGKLSFESIRESLRHLRSSTPSRGLDRSNGSLNSLSLKDLRDSLKMKPPLERTERSSSLLGSESVLPSSIFEKELREKTEMESQALKTEFVKMYTYDELGEKLKMLRPIEATSGKKNWFSLVELNERLMKLREMEEKETESRIGGVSFKDLRDSLAKLRKNSDESSKRSSSKLSSFHSKI